MILREKSDLTRCSAASPPLHMKRYLSENMYIIFHLILPTLSCSRSGRSALTTAASSCSSRPSRVTVKLMRVHCACSSGWKWGFASFVCRIRRKAGLNSHSLSPILMYLKLEQKEHGCTFIPGQMVASASGIHQKWTLPSPYRNHF